MQVKFSESVSWLVSTCDLAGRQREEVVRDFGIMLSKFNPVKAPFNHKDTSLNQGQWSELRVQTTACHSNSVEIRKLQHYFKCDLFIHRIQLFPHNFITLFTSIVLSVDLHSEDMWMYNACTQALTYAAHAHTIWLKVYNICSVGVIRDFLLFFPG